MASAAHIESGSTEKAIGGSEPLLAKQALLFDSRLSRNGHRLEIGKDHRDFAAWVALRKGRPVPARFIMRLSPLADVG